MAAVTTPWNLPYPQVTDSVNPLNTWFANLAQATNDALEALEASVVDEPLPFPVSAKGAPQTAITATAFSDIPNMGSVTLEIPQACWVTIVGGAWMHVSTSNGSTIRAGIQVSGATTLGETQLEVGGSTDAWGQVMIKDSAGTDQCSSTRFVRLNAGSNVIKMRAYRTGSGNTTGVNYPTLQVSPVRWA